MSACISVNPRLLLPLRSFASFAVELRATRMFPMKIALGADHGGYELKNRIKSWLADRGIATEDFGTDSPDSCDYPDIAAPVCRQVAAGRVDRGILCCGTGLGMSIAANKVAGIRAAHVTSENEAALSRQHNDANILALGGRTLSDDLAHRIVDTWLDTAFSGDTRHARRIDKTMALEKQEHLAADKR